MKPKNMQKNILKAKEKKNKKRRKAQKNKSSIKLQSILFSRGDFPGVIPIKRPTFELTDFLSQEC